MLDDLASAYIKRALEVALFVTTAAAFGSNAAFAQNSLPLGVAVQRSGEPGRETTAPSPLSPEMQLLERGPNPENAPIRNGSPPPLDGNHRLASPDGRFVAYENKAKDGYHDTIWLKDSKTATVIDILAPDDATWPGAGATEILDWVDDDKLAFTYHCGTGCTSLETFSVKKHVHLYLCMSTRFYLSPDKKYAVGETGAMEFDDENGGLALISTKGGHRSESNERDCKLIIHGIGVCEPGEKKLGAVEFDHWSPDGGSFVYRVLPCDHSVSEERVYKLKMNNDLGEIGERAD